MFVYKVPRLYLCEEVEGDRQEWPLTSVHLLNLCFFSADSAHFSPPAVVE